MIEAGVMKKHERSAKRLTKSEFDAIATGTVGEAIVVRKTLFCVIPETDSETVFVIV